jgi:hypothetical protein
MLVSTQFLTEQPDKLAALWSGNRAPSAKCGMRVVDSLVGGVRRNLMNFSDYLAGDRRSGAKRAASVSRPGNAEGRKQRFYFGRKASLEYCGCHCVQFQFV